MRPLIGLNCNLMDLDEPLKAKAHCHLKYIDAVSGSGGVPVLIPPYTDRTMLEEALAPLDGFCLIGGPDYDPAHYGGHAQPAADLMPARRHTFDIWLAEAILKKSSKPVLGICGGHQLLNIALGGALLQDIRAEWRPTEKQSATLLHSDSEREGSPQAGNVYRHEVKLVSGSLIARIIGAPKLLTNSYHHQAVPPDRIGAGLLPTAWAPDGVIEALELNESSGRFVLGVQWHPERLTEEPAHKAIFEALVTAAGST